MKTSARNHFSGEVTEIKSGAVNDEITLRVDGTTIVAVVTQESTKTLGLAVGAKASALIKASSVIVMLDSDPSKISTRNVLSGTVADVKTGAVNTEVTISAGSLQIAAIITNDSATRLGLAKGSPASAVFKASSVIIAVD
ncbi:Molybdate-binding domain of ModE [Caballeronia glathei]|jgi:molybdopterin-binding protein|uniref:Transporter n=1 Tax=Caballeronia glathei TaxID=60547 RepID=A0A069PM08_9BURK|nr:MULTISPECIES: TOBE domain-containing protein [Burkholderiaceae]KDR41472.1 transporter [Caballeronia glathei]TCK36445.1 molybdopterin-binding protein [Paraburkholderia sp. BL8N3]CDY77289.1 Molybdate-binding domain of ModE [Caballeronia glathei]